ncbi:MAG: glycosyltransferase family 4 protein [Clostridiales bacterium]|nr:glycosyltransferase family 4 protein [Clostridiales bacterium]
MNILYLNNSMHLGGDTKCILNLCREFKSTNKIIAASKGGKLIKEFKNMNIKHYYIKDVLNKFPHVIIFNIFRLIKIVKYENIEIIHSHHRMTTFIAKIVSKFIKVKVIHTQHAIIKDKKILTRMTFKHITIIAVSNAVKENLINDYKLDSNMIKVIYNAIDNRKSNKEVDLRILEYKKQGFFLVGCISRITKGKGIRVFIDAANSINKHGKKIKFIIIGDGDKRIELENYCKKMDIDNVDFLGFKSNVIDYISNLDLIVQPSYSEGLGLTAIEALSQSKPVIASDIPALREVVIDNYNGLLFPPGNSKQLVKAIYRVFNNKDLKTKLSENAFRHYNDVFNSKSYYVRHKKIYEY